MFKKKRLLASHQRVWVVDGVLSATPQELSLRLKTFMSKEIREGRFDIPPLPQVAAELNRLVNSDRPDLSKCTALIERDPPLTAKVLAFAGSVAFGSQVPVIDLKQAVVRVGSSGLRDIVFTVMMGRMFRCSALKGRMEQAIKKSFLLGQMSTCLCKFKGMDLEEGFLSGLLADIGNPALLAVLEVLGTESPAWLREDVINDILGKLHCTAGALILAHWGLSKRLHDVARWHHAPENATIANKLTRLVSAADRIVEARLPDPEDYAAALLSDPPIFQLAGIHPKRIPALIDAVHAAEESAQSL